MVRAPFASPSSLARLGGALAVIAAVVVACGGDDPTPAGPALPGSGPDGGSSSGGVDDGGASSSSSGDAAPVGCGEFEGKTVFTCSKDGRSRGKCVQGARVVESCARGCLKPVAPATEGTCMGTTSAFSCTGTTGTTKAADGDYYVTAFGCWVDEAGVKHGDPGDNCLPSCIDTLRKQGVCAASLTGKECEEKITWFTADAKRFGCGAKIRVENPANGKAVIAMAIDDGPGCTLENSVKKPVLDASGRVDRALFGADKGATDKALVHVVEVDPATPLGPAP